MKRKKRCLTKRQFSVRLRLSQPSSSGCCDAVLGITPMTLISAESTASLLSGTAGIFKMRKSFKSYGTLKKRWKNLSPATGWGLKAYPISRQLSLATWSTCSSSLTIILTFPLGGAVTLIAALRSVYRARTVMNSSQEAMTSDLELIDIQTHPRFLVEPPLKHRLVLSYRVHKRGCARPPG